MGLNAFKTVLSTLYLKSKKATDPESVVKEKLREAASNGEKSVWFYDQDMVVQAEKVAKKARLNLEVSVDDRGEKSIKVFGWEV